MSSDRLLQVDSVFGALKIISEEHALIHNGELYSCAQYNAALGNNAHIYFEIRCHADFAVHLKNLNLWMTEAPWIVKLIEAPTIGTPGTTPVVAFNRKRGSALTLNASIFSNPATISGGIDLMPFMTGGGSGVGITVIAGSAESGIEWELEEGVTYVLDIQNTSGGAAAISAQLDMYEENEA